MGGIMIGLIPSVNNFQAIYRRSVAYLCNSPFAAEVISSLDESPLHLGILITEQGGCEYVPPYDRRCPRYLDGGIIFWNINKTVETMDFAYNDPRLGLNEARRENVPWNREISFPGRVMEVFFGPRTRLGLLTPSMCLMHEMGHALQYFSDSNAFLQLHNNNYMELENINVRAIEATVVQELRNLGYGETARWDYAHINHYPGGRAWPNWLRWFYG